jgi:hypothetical protein
MTRRFTSNAGTVTVRRHGLPVGTQRPSVFRTMGRALVGAIRHPMGMLKSTYRMHHYDPER